jgi:large subunit ribosomal protein L25
MEKIELKAKTRTILGDRVKSLRKQKQIPAVLYGHGIKNSLPLVVNSLDFRRLYKKAGESTIFSLLIDDKEKKNVLIKDIQFDPVNSDYNHIDFYQIKMSEKITAKVDLSFVGEAPAVKEKGGVLVKNFDVIEVECLPLDLPREIKVDISSLKTFDDVVKISDLNISKKIKVMADLNEVVATVTPPRSEEELKSLEEEVIEKVEEVKGVKKEEPKPEATEQEAAASPEKKEEKSAKGGEAYGGKEEAKTKKSK